MTALTVSSRLEPDLFCPECHNIFTEPVTLLCGHSLCQRCLYKFRGLRHPPICPLCGQAVYYKPQINLVLNSLSENYRMRSQLDPSGGHNLLSGEVTLLIDLTVLNIICRVVDKIFHNVTFLKATVLVILCHMLENCPNQH